MVPLSSDFGRQALDVAEIQARSCEAAPGVPQEDMLTDPPTFNAEAGDD